MPCPTQPHKAPPGSNIHAPKGQAVTRLRMGRKISQTLRFIQKNLANKQAETREIRLVRRSFRVLASSGRRWELRPYTEPRIS